MSNHDEASAEQVDQCPGCNGQGVRREVVGYVTHDMAMDAGEMQMEGQPMEDDVPCPMCNGSGVIESEQPADEGGTPSEHVFHGVLRGNLASKSIEYFRYSPMWAAVEDALMQLSPGSPSDAGADQKLRTAVGEYIAARTRWSRALETGVTVAQEEALERTWTRLCHVAFGVPVTGGPE